MFRRFYKALPRADGRSLLDREEEFVNKTRHMWDETQKALLRKLVTPVPKPFRPTAEHAIAGKIGELALARQLKKIDQATLIEGYILATPKRDHRWLLRALAQSGIDHTPYQHLFKR